MSGRFSAIPEIPTGLQDWQGVLLNALKENVELLTATRGEADTLSQAVVHGDISVNQVGQQEMGTIDASDSTVPTGFIGCAPLSAFLDLRRDVQQLANDLHGTRVALDLLIQNVKEG